MLGAAALTALVAGCATQRDDSLRLSEELGRARANSAWQQARAAELESRMLQLEQRTATAQTTERAEARQLLLQLQRLLELNQRQLAQHATAPLPASSAPSAPPASATKTAASGAPGLSDEQALRALVEHLRGRPGSPHGGLTREQENALRVLTRPERKLDTENPWPAAFY